MSCLESETKPFGLILNMLVHLNRIGKYISIQIIKR